MTGIEPQISGIGIDRSANCTAITAQHQNISLVEGDLIPLPDPIDLYVSLHRAYKMFYDYIISSNKTIEVLQG